MVDYIRIAGTMENRVAEYVSHLHEHFVDGVVVRSGAYMPPVAPGYGITMKPESLERYCFPSGPVWARLDKEVRP